jgi:hypothetical protein
VENRLSRGAREARHGGDDNTLIVTGKQDVRRGRFAGTTITVVATSLLVFVAGNTVNSQWLNHPTPGLPRAKDGKPDLSAPVPRTVDGKPDLTGLWRRGTTGFVSDIVRDLKISGVVMTPWAESVYQQREQRDHVDDPLGYCLPSPSPRLNATVHFKIIHTPTLVAILYETSSGSTFRQVFTDGRALPTGDVEPTFLGYSVGRWEGETFVVETNGFRDRGWFDIAGHPHSDALRVTERFRRVTLGHMELTMTVDDRKAYVKPWTVSFPLVLRPDTELIESFCEGQHKHNDLRRIAPAPPEPPSR